ncbi:MAG: hypothetical protein D6742_13640 [Cyanobacteria bacterium J069]|nr:MAG: hypothetical protein D6742_13640 [Cyanobacteria bacterium J069]
MDSVDSVRFLTSRRSATFYALESLEEYVLINTRRQRVECFRRNDAGLWVLQFYMAEAETFRLESLDFTVCFSDLYEDVVLEPSPERPDTHSL